MMHKHILLGVAWLRGAMGSFQQADPFRLVYSADCRAVVTDLAGKRKYGFALERAVFLTVLHRLFVSGSDRAADRWREDYAIAGVDGLDLHHLYRAMAWPGEVLSEKEQDGRTPFAPRCVKGAVEERLCSPGCTRPSFFCRRNSRIFGPIW